MNKENKVRGKNFAKDEKLQLVKELSTYHHIIENKVTNMTSNREKEEAWANVTINFNKNKPEIQQQTEQCLRLCWENLKRHQKILCTATERIV